jgi:adenylate cyclase
MAIEIERKFLISRDDWRRLVTETKRIRQGYLGRDDSFSIRIRITDKRHGTLTVKSSQVELSRLEFEYSIPLADAEQLLSQCRGHIIAKVRHLVPWQGLVWEIDLFTGYNAGLIIAEIELASEAQQLDLPGWIGDEITGQKRYSNSWLVDHPFTSWSALCPG